MESVVGHQVNQVIDEKEKHKQTYSTKLKVALETLVEMKETEDRRACCCIAKRYVTAILMCIGLFLTRGMRTNLWAATAPSHDEKWNPKDNVLPIFVWPGYGDQWSFFSFSYAGLLSILIGGILTCKFPANRLFGIAVAGSSVLHLLLPVAIEFVGLPLVIVINVLKGLLEGIIFPAFYAIWRFWAPPLENTCLVTIALFGLCHGQFFGHQISVLIMDSTIWSASFYIFGSLSLVWSVLWFWLSYDRPSNHPAIHPKEVAYMHRTMGNPETTTINLKDIPWRSMLTSLPFYAIVILGLCCGWNSFLVYANIPKETSAMNATLCSMAAAVLILGIVSDVLRCRYYVSTTLIRKYFTSGGLFAFTILLPVIAFHEFEVEAFNNLLGSLLCVAHMIVVTGFLVNILDITPRYAALIMSVLLVLTKLATLTHVSILNNSTEAATHLLRAGQVLKILRAIYIASTVINFIVGLLYAIFASGKKQSWETTPTTEVPMTEKDEISPT